MGELILITGGVRCGKSRFAERLAADLADGARVAYVATAEALDDEMRHKIATHRADRPAGWVTLEAPRDVATAIVEATACADAAPVVLVDCLTMLVSNLLLLQGESVGGTTATQRVAHQVEALRDACLRSSATVVVVTNEVGWGVVPESSLGRRYRDLLGSANQTLASAASRVYLLVAGVAVDLKTLAQAVQP
jgi:adenosylcobinamide kinase/adenosylcobinamide-phosphate guanylyltransferase